MRGQAYLRLNLSGRIRLLGQLSGVVTAYRSSQFDDFSVSPLIGPEISFSADRVTLMFGPSWRWYGTKPYTADVVTTVAWQHELNPRSALRVDGSYNQISNRLNADESGSSYTLSVAMDRSITAQLGGGLQANAFRRLASLPAYSLAGVGASVYVFRDIGHLTVSAIAACSHLEADDRLVLFPHRRIDNAGAVTLSVNVRNLRVSNVSPVFRVRYERNLSNLQIYRYRRLSGEVGLSTSF